MNHGDGGKGSGRRKEDASKVRDNWDLIFKSKKDTAMIEDPQDLSEDNERSEFIEECEWTCEECEWTCDVCGGPMYSAACRAATAYLTLWC